MSSFPENSAYNSYDSYDSISGLSSHSSSGQSAIENAIRNQEDAAPDRHQFRFGSGASLILIVLVIISIICFAALSIVSARADDRLTDRYVEEADGFQTAYNRGQDFIAHRDADLRSVYDNLASADSDSDAGHSADASGDNTLSDTQKAAYFEAASRLAGSVDPSDTSLSYYDSLQEILQNTQSTSVSSVLVFTAAVSDTQEYLLVLEPLWPDDHNGAFYRVLSSKVIPTASYEYDSTLNVLK